MYICAKFGACITKCTIGLLCCPTKWAESSKMLCLEEVIQVVVPVEHQTTTVFGLVHQNAAL